MAGHHKTCAALDPAGRVLQNASWYLGDPPTRFAPDMLVMIGARLVVGLAIAQVDAADDSVTLHRGNGAEDARVISPTQNTLHGLV